jgi:predicted negative regulator of RcsB-dependent stress response
MITTFFASTINKVFAGVVLALLVALGIAMWSNARKDATIETLRNAVAVSEAQHSVTAASLDSLTRRMKELVEQGQLRESLLAEAMKEAEEETSELQDEADALRKEGVTDQCVTPAGVLRSRGL